MTIASLEPGTTFRFTSCGKQAVLLYLSPCGATVQYLGREKKEVVIAERIVRGKTIPARRFMAATQGKPVTVSVNSEVTV